jgi:ABC-type ATPase involved in cell division
VNVLIELANETAGYGGRPVLRAVDLTIRTGERIAVLGRSGAGKTTLLNLLYGRLAERVALVPQGSALVKTLSVFHNVYMGRLDRHPTWYNIRTLVWPARGVVGEVAAVLDLVGLRDALFARAGELSGGQQQRASVARALYNGRPNRGRAGLGARPRPGRRNSLAPRLAPRDDHRGSPRHLSCTRSRRPDRRARFRAHRAGRAVRYAHGRGPDSVLRGLT